MVQFYSNHKTTEPSESTLSKRCGSIKSDFNKFYHKTSSPDNIFGSFDYNGIESKSNLVNSKLKADNTFDFCNGSIKSLVPQRLIMDANRRQQDAVKLGTRSTHNLICERKLDEKSIESLNNRFDYYAVKKAEKYNQKIAEKEKNENDQIEFLKKNRIGSIHSTFTPELSKKQSKIAKEASSRLFNYAAIIRTKIEAKRKSKIEAEMQDIKNNMVGKKSNELTEYLDITKSSKDVFERLAQDQSSRNCRVYVNDSPSGTDIEYSNKKSRKLLKGNKRKLKEYHSVDYFSPNKLRTKITKNKEDKCCTPNQLPKKPYYWTNKNRFASTDCLKPKISHIKVNTPLVLKLANKIPNSDL